METSPLARFLVLPRAISSGVSVRSKPTSTVSQYSCGFFEHCTPSLTTTDGTVPTVGTVWAGTVGPDGSVVAGTVGPPGTGTVTGPTVWPPVGTGPTVLPPTGVSGVATSPAMFSRAVPVVVSPFQT